MAKEEKRYHNNIVRCNNCSSILIRDELDSHVCFRETKAHNFMYDTGTEEYHISDGKRWYRWFPEWIRKAPTRNQHDSKHYEDSTEPKFVVDILFEKKYLHFQEQLLQFYLIL